MLSDIKNKILGLSSDYTFYKTNYEKVSEENKRLKEEIENLRNEKDDFILKILSCQDDLNTNLDAIRKENHENTLRILSQDTKNNETLDKISEISQRINSTQNTTQTQFQELKNEIHTGNDGILTGIGEVKSGQNNLSNNFSEENERIIDALLSNQEHFSRNLKRNYDLLTSVEELALKVEKSSAYTNIKLDSKFDDNNRLLENYSDRICERISEESK